MHFGRLFGQAHGVKRIFWHGYSAVNITRDRNCTGYALGEQFSFLISLASDSAISRACS